MQKADTSQQFLREISACNFIYISKNLSHILL